MQRIILIRGPLGVGKTIVSRTLAEKLGASYVSIDRTLEELNLDKSDGECIPAKNFLAAQEHVLPQIKDALDSGKNVIIDGNFYHKAQIEHFAEHFGEQLRIFTLHASIEVCIERDGKRRQPYGEDATRAVHWLVSRFEAGTIIDTEDKSVDQVANEILIDTNS